MKYDLWDVEVNRYLGQFEEESEALVLVRTLVNHYGPAYAEDLELGGITAEGEITPSLSGAALLARADEVLTPSQHDSASRNSASRALDPARRPRIVA